MTTQHKSLWVSAKEEIKRIDAKIVAETATMNEIGRGILLAQILDKIMEHNFAIIEENNKLVALGILP